MSQIELLRARILRRFGRPLFLVSMSFIVAAYAAVAWPLISDKLADCVLPLAPVLTLRIGILSRPAYAIGLYGNRGYLPNARSALNTGDRYQVEFIDEDGNKDPIKDLEKEGHAEGVDILAA